MPTKGPETHSHPHPDGRAYWWTQRLWREAAGLEPRLVPTDLIAEFDKNCWFGDTPPTCREVAEHAQRIFDADLSQPVILSADGHLMDGGHRIAKSWLDGQSKVLAVQFVDDPDPDWIE